MIHVDQDPLGLQGTRISETDDGREIWSRYNKIHKEFDIDFGLELLVMVTELLFC